MLRFQAPLYRFLLRIYLFKLSGTKYLIDFPFFTRFLTVVEEIFIPPDLKENKTVSAFMPVYDHLFCIAV